LEYCVQNRDIEIISTDNIPVHVNSQSSINSKFSVLLSYFDTYMTLLQRTVVHNTWPLLYNATNLTKPKTDTHAVYNILEQKQ